MSSSLRDSGDFCGLVVRGDCPRARTLFRPIFEQSLLEFHTATAHDALTLLPDSCLQPLFRHFADHRVRRVEDVAEVVPDTLPKQQACAGCV